MKNRIKFIIATLVMALGFFFCISMVSVSADGGDTTTTETVNIVGVYEYAEEGKGNAKFTLYSNNTFEVEAHDLASNETINRTGTYTLNGDLLEISNGVDTSIKFKIANGNQLIPYEVATEQEEEVSEEVDSFVEHLKDLKWDEAEAIIGWLITYLVANFGVIVFCIIKLVLNKLNETKQSKAFQDALAKLSLEHQEEVKKMIAEFENQLNAVNDNSQAFIEEQKAKIQELQSDATKEISQELKQVNELLLK